MRFIALLSTFACTALAFKFKAAVPRDSKGKLVSHALPVDNLPLIGKTKADIGVSVGVKTGVKFGKRRLIQEYVPTAEELDNLARDFEDHIPAHAKRDPSPVKMNGVVAVFSAEQGFMGYIRLSLSQYATTGLTTDLNQVAYVRMPNAAPQPHFDLGIYNASAPYLAVIQGYSGSNWGAGNPGYGSMTVVQHSTYPASNTNNPTFLPSESNIWTVNMQTSQLTATWFNDNGTPVPCTIYYDIRYSDFGFTGDLAQYVKLYLDSTVAVALYFIPVW